MWVGIAREQPPACSMLRGGSRLFQSLKKTWSKRHADASPSIGLALSLPACIDPGTSVGACMAHGVDLSGNRITMRRIQGASAPLHDAPTDHALHAAVPAAPALPKRLRFVFEPYGDNPHPRYEVVTLEDAAAEPLGTGRSGQEPSLPAQVNVEPSEMVPGQSPQPQAQHVAGIQFSLNFSASGGAAGPGLVSIEATAARTSAHVLASAAHLPTQHGIDQLGSDHMQAPGHPQMHPSQIHRSDPELRASGGRNRDWDTVDELGLVGRHSSRSGHGERSREHVQADQRKRAAVCTRDRSPSVSNSPSPSRVSQRRHGSGSGDLNFGPKFQTELSPKAARSRRNINPDASEGRGGKGSRSQPSASPREPQLHRGPVGSATPASDYLQRQKERSWARGRGGIERDGLKWSPEVSDHGTPPPDVRRDRGRGGAESGRYRRDQRETSSRAVLHCGASDGAAGTAKRRRGWGLKAGEHCRSARSPRMHLLLCAYMHH